MIVAKCSKADEPIDEPIAPESPCEDKWGICPEMAKEKCYENWVGEECPKSCGKCPGEKKSSFEIKRKSETLNQEPPLLLQTPATIF